MNTSLAEPGESWMTPAGEITRLKEGKAPGREACACVIKKVRETLGNPRRLTTNKIAACLQSIHRGRSPEQYEKAARELIHLIRTGIGKNIEALKEFAGDQWGWIHFDGKRATIPNMLPETKNLLHNLLESTPPITPTIQARSIRSGITLTLDHPAKPALKESGNPTKKTSP